MTRQPATAAGRALLGAVERHVTHADEVRQVILAIEAEAAPPDALRDAHIPGNPHRYRIQCEVCGQRGTVNLSIEPQYAPLAALAEPTGGPKPMRDTNALTNERPTTDWEPQP